MKLYRSIPSKVEAVRYVDGQTRAAEMDEIAPDKWKLNLGTGELSILAGKDGAQGWVPVPEGHYVVRQPGDPSDIWPVEGAYFRAKYELPHGED